MSLTGQVKRHLMVSLSELWMGQKPRTSRLRIIGSTCYVHVPTEKRKKMDQKAQKGYLVG